MCKVIMRVAVAAAAAASVSALGVTGASASGAATGAPHPARALLARAPVAAAVPGAQIWVKRYSRSSLYTDVATSVAVSPSGGTVFVTGYSTDPASVYYDYATIAYNAATGAQLWVKRYNGPANRSDEAHSVAVSPSGGTVFVTGYSEGASSAEDYATVAYNAATGAQRWVKRYNSPANSIDHARAVAVSPTGGTVFVTGFSAGATSGTDYATVAYNAATGAQRWVKRYNGPANGSDDAYAVAVSPRGASVFVTGYDTGTITGPDYATVAYNAATGAQRWVKRYNGTANIGDYATSAAVSPDNGTVFVTGQSVGAAGLTQSFDYATVAYNAATGAVRWVKRYNGPANSGDYANSVAVSPTKDTVFVTGGSTGTITGVDYTTIAYYAPNGAQLWVKRYDPGNLLPAGNDDAAYSLAVSPSGGTVFVTGASTGATSRLDYATVAYNAATGAQRWVTRYNGPGDYNDYASSLVVSPGGDRVFVTGGSDAATGRGDYATIAYNG